MVVGVCRLEGVGLFYMAHSILLRLQIMGGGRRPLY